MIHNANVIQKAVALHYPPSLRSTGPCTRGHDVEHVEKLQKRSACIVKVSKIIYYEDRHRKLNLFSMFRRHCSRNLILPYHTSPEVPLYGGLVHMPENEQEFSTMPSRYFLRVVSFRNCPPVEVREAFKRPKLKIKFDSLGLSNLFYASLPSI